MPAVTLYLGETLRVLDTLEAESIDAVITDPPYLSGGMTLTARSADPAKKYVSHGQKLQRPSFAGDNRDGRSLAYWCTLWITQCLRLVTPGGYFLMFTDWRQLPLMTVRPRTTAATLQEGGERHGADLEDLASRRIYLPPTQRSRAIPCRLCRGTVWGRGAEEKDAAADCRLSIEARAVSLYIPIASLLGRSTANSTKPIVSCACCWNDGGQLLPSPSVRIYGLVHRRL